MFKDVVFIHSGLGNQMFEYAFYLARKKIKPDTICNMGLLKGKKNHQCFELNKLFNTNIKSFPLSTFIARVANYSRLLTKVFSKLNIEIVTDVKPFIHSNKSNYFVGYWQSEKFFENIKDEVCKIFSFKRELLSKETCKYENIIKQSNSVSIHIRRGDYTLPQYNKIYGNICTIDYYTKAIKHICQNVEQPNFFVFSNEIEWVKENIKIPNPHYVDCNSGKNSWQDMYLMTQCKHNIVANSTFSWWGAYLNKNSKKIVICPSKYDNTGASAEIFPTAWIKIK